MQAELAIAKTDAGPLGTDEHRSSLRRQYYYRQSIAPITDEGIPIFEELSDVDCKDISGGGLSYYAESRPNYKRLLVALGLPPNSQYFLAKVLRTTRETNGVQERYLVGCSFIKRIYL